MAFVGKAYESCFYPGCETIAGNRLHCEEHRLPPSPPPLVMCLTHHCQAYIDRSVSDEHCERHARVV